MKKSQIGLLLLVLFFLTWAMTAKGEQTKTDPASSTKSPLRPEEIKSLLNQIKDYLGLTIYLQGGYTFNFRNPDSGLNRLRVFDQKANTFLIDLAQIQFAKEATSGGVGYKLKVSAGETAKFIHSMGLGDPDDVVDLTEAYVDYLAPLGTGLKLRFGKFVTYHGAETIEAKDNFNDSRGFLFNFAIPFTHTGLTAEYALSKSFMIGLYLVNGWDVTNDPNKGKTIGMRFGMTPIESLTIAIHLMYGPEQKDNNSHDRFLLDWVGTFRATDKLTFMVNVDYAREQKDPLNFGQNSRWYGIAAYAKYDFTHFFSAAIRGEYFHDQMGVRTGIQQRLKEVTITPEIRLTKDLLLRPEYRHDWSNRKGFDSNNNDFRKKSQDTIALGVMYTW